MCLPPAASAHFVASLAFIAIPRSFVCLVLFRELPTNSLARGGPREHPPCEGKVKNTVKTIAKLAGLVVVLNVVRYTVGGFIEGFTIMEPMQRPQPASPPVPSD